MICVVHVLARVAPGDVHLTRGQVNDQRADGLLAVERIGPLNVMVADRVRHVDMVFLNGLQALNSVFVRFVDEA